MCVKEIKGTLRLVGRLWETNPFCSSFLHTAHNAEERKKNMVKCLWWVPLASLPVSWEERREEESLWCLYAWPSGWKRRGERWDGMGWNGMGANRFRDRRGATTNSNNRKQLSHPPPSLHPPPPRCDMTPMNNGERRRRRRGNFPT